jgi:hypothetical protein
MQDIFSILLQSTLTVLCNHPHYPILEYCHPPKKNILIVTPGQRLLYSYSAFMNWKGQFFMTICCLPSSLEATFSIWFFLVDKEHCPTNNTR